MFGVYNTSVKYCFVIKMYGVSTENTVFSTFIDQMNYLTYYLILVHFLFVPNGTHCSVMRIEFIYECLFYSMVLKYFHFILSCISQ